VDAAQLTIIGEREARAVYLLLGELAPGPGGRLVVRHLVSQGLELRRSHRCKPVEGCSVLRIQLGADIKDRNLHSRARRQGQRSTRSRRAGADYQC
jgi:hypothetical protein